MTHGLPTGTTVLYTQDGQPVAVELVDGAYRLVTHDRETHNELTEIKVLLHQILEALELREH